MSAKNTKLSPRIRIRETDSLKTTRSKSTESGMAVGSVKPFSDDRVFIFDQTTVVYPSMLPSGSSLSDVAGIVTTGRVRPGTSDVHGGIETETIAPYTEHRNDVTGESVSGLGMDPSFSGSLGSRMSIKIDISAREDSYIYRCPQRHIDADPDGEFKKPGTGFAYFNFVTKRWDHIGDSYSRKNWLSLGSDPIVTDQVHVISESLHGPTSRSLGIRYVATGSENYAGQFVPPDFFSTLGFNGDNAYKTLRPANFDDKIAMGAHKTGTPTITHYAPASSKYHATSSNVIRMSDYISEPFLLEKIKIQLPVVARRVHQSSSMDPDGFWNQCNDLHCREMDNYVVFLYRQVRNFTGFFPESVSNKRDTYEDALKSVRFLVASASMCFYNLPTHIAGINGIAQDPGGTTFGFSNTIFGPRDVEDSVNFLSYFDSSAVNGSYNTDAFPYHTPQFKHDFNMPVISSTSSIAPKQVGLFTGSVSLVMEPSISPAGRSGSRRVLVFSSSIKTGDRAYHYAASSIRYLGLKKERINSYLQHAWPGTAGVYPFGGFEGGPSYSGRTLFNNIPSHFRTTYAASDSVTPVEIFYTTLTDLSVYENTFTDGQNYNYVPPFTSTLFSRPVGYQDVLSRGLLDVSLPDVRSLTGIFGPAKSYTKGKFETDLDNGSFMLGETSFSSTGVRSKPIVLLPTDELILGIDAGIVPFRADNGTITGSFIKIEAKGAEITLYGSQIINGEKRQHYGKSQTLGSAIGGSEVSTPIIDEFLLEHYQTTYGNYHAPLATGSLLERVVQNYPAVPPVLPLATPVLLKTLAAAGGAPNPVDWYAYPRYVTLIDDKAKVIDIATSRVDAPNLGAPPPIKYVFRNDKFGQTAHMMASYTGAAVKASKDTLLPTIGRKRVSEEIYPITNVFTGSTSITLNTSLHATSSGPYFDY